MKTNELKAVVLGNLCGSYIFNHMNEKAEVLLSGIKDSVQTCLINLIIGTLYCCNGNYGFGLVKLMESVDPIASKLTLDTWFYVKRCLLSHLYKITTIQQSFDTPLIANLIEFLQLIDNEAVQPTIKKESRLLQYAYYKCVLNV